LNPFALLGLVQRLPMPNVRVAGLGRHKWMEIEMNKLAFIAPLVLLGGCAAMPPPAEDSAPAKPSVNSTDVQAAIDQAVAQALAAEQVNDIDVESTVNQAVEKAVAETVRELQVLEEEKKQLQAAETENGDRAASPSADKKQAPRQATTRVRVPRPMLVHPTVALKREIRDCALELLMYDTHVADATDACLRIYRSQRFHERWSNDRSTVRTSTHP
jgi:hypothetical protein